MTDKERITKIIGDINEFISKIKLLNVSAEEDLKKDWKTLHAGAMLIFGATSRSIDLAQELIASKEWGVPSSYQEHFYLLYENNAISKELWQKLSYLVKVRNLIAHEYYRFMLSDVVKALQISVTAIPSLVNETKKLLNRD
ncbi:DUF86 domain-containing protein [Candidatus Woesearchaeota archaeon]|nr:DUF86 domain-containing protein [Candidatus Woesearchaeota archaeon]